MQSSPNRSQDGRIRSSDAGTFHRNESGNDGQSANPNIVQAVSLFTENSSVVASHSSGPISGTIIPISDSDSESEGESKGETEPTDSLSDDQPAGPPPQYERYYQPPDVALANLYPAVSEFLSRRGSAILVYARIHGALNYSRSDWMTLFQEAGLSRLDAEQLFHVVVEVLPAEQSSALQIEAEADS